MLQVKTARALTKILSEPTGSAYFDNLLAQRPDWLALIKLSTKQWLGGALATVLDREGIITRIPDKSLQHLLLDMKNMAAARVDSLSAELGIIASIIGKTSPLVLLKGSEDLAQLADGRRWMMDIDLVVEEANIKKCYEKLVSHGYQRLNNIPFSWSANDWHQTPTLAHPDRGITIELHRHFLSLRCRSFPQGDWFAQALKNECIYQHSQFYKLPESISLILRILHCQVSNSSDVEMNISLRHLYNIHLYIERNEELINWAVVRCSLDNFRPDLFDRWLVINQRYFSSALNVKASKSIRANNYLRLAELRHSLPVPVQIGLLALSRLRGKLRKGSKRFDTTLPYPAHSIERYRKTLASYQKLRW